MAAAESGRNNRAKDLALAGLLGSLILLFLTAAAWSPTANLAFFTLASLAVAIAVIENGPGSGSLLYGATALISLAWPGLPYSWPYILFFGPYPLLRALTDRRLSARLAWAVRLMLGLILAGLGVALFSRVFIQEQLARLNSFFWPALAIAGPVVLALYDWALSLLIALYARRLRRFR